MEEADPEYRGRVNGVYTMNFGLMPLGTIPIAAIASVYGIDIAFLGSSLLLIIFALSCFIFAKKIRIL